MKFSVIMPTFQRPHTLPRAIESVLAQSHSDWELIVVNNSEDAVAVPDDPRIRLVQHAEKASASYARNQGLQYASGDVVYFTDDDDFTTYDALAIFDYVFGLHKTAKLVCAQILLKNGHVSDVLSTQAAAVLREFAVPAWDDRDYLQDQRFWANIIAANGWSEAAGDIVRVTDRVVSVLTTDPRGGLRAGGL